jgi:hypothetical protein
MIDISKTTEAKSDQLNSDDLIGGPRTITITGVGANEGGEQPINVFFEGDGGKPFRPCKGVRRVMMAIWGNDGSTYAGKSMTIWRDPGVTWGGMAVGGIRISHMSHMERDTTLAITESKKKRTPLTVRMLKVEAPAAPVRNMAVEAHALAAAAQGVASFTAWWKSDYGVANRASVGPVKDECKRIAQEFDAAQVSDSEEEPPM